MFHFLFIAGGWDIFVEWLMFHCIHWDGQTKKQGSSVECKDFCRLVVVLHVG